MQNVSSRLQTVYGEPAKPNHGMLGIQSPKVISPVLLIFLCVYREGAHRIQVIAAAKKKLSDLMTAAEASIFELPSGPFETRRHQEFGSRVPPKGRRDDEEFNKSVSFSTGFYDVMFNLSISLT